MHTDCNSAENENYACDHAKNERLCTMKSPWEQGDTFYLVQSFRGGFGILVISIVSRRRDPEDDQQPSSTNREGSQGEAGALLLGGCRDQEELRGAEGFWVKVRRGSRLSTLRPLFQMGMQRNWRSASNLG